MFELLLKFRYLAVVMVILSLLHAHGAPADILVDASGADPKEKAKIAHELGIDRPIAEQYVSWIGGLSRGEIEDAIACGELRAEDIVTAINGTAIDPQKIHLGDTDAHPAASPVAAR